MNIHDFDDIRPFIQEEIPAALERIASSETFPIVMNYLFPGQDVENRRRQVRRCRNAEDLQKTVIFEAFIRLMEKTTVDFSFDGTDRVTDMQRPFLFISNHRDIVLDSMMLQYILLINMLDTTEITFGENLMKHPFVVDVGKVCKMFRVKRATPTRDFYVHSMHLSEYIRYVMTELGHSVWIAQRNGRTKDGLDKTDQGVVKMVGMSSRDDVVKAFTDTMILPVAVSYEFEPCAFLKARELYIKRQNGGSYFKSPNEDLHSILTGLCDYKGRIHLSICDPVSETLLSQWKGKSLNFVSKEIASFIDSQIYQNYRLFPNNYIACDILSGTSEYARFYSGREKDVFLSYLERGLADIDTALSESKDDAMEQMRNIVLEIYANPVHTHY